MNTSLRNRLNCTRIKWHKLHTIFDLLAALGLEIRVVPRSKMKPGDLEDIF